MSPHEQPWLDDYADRHQVELQARWDEDAVVFNIQNAALRTVLNECPHGEGCKVGSLTCSRCPKYQKRDGDIVYCKAGRKKKGKADE